MTSRTKAKSSPRSKPAKAAMEDESVLSGRFYSALIGMSESAGPRQTCRRQVMGLLQEITARIRSRGKASSGSTGYHASVNYIAVLLYRANGQHTVRAREIQRGLGYTAGGMTRRLDVMVRDELLVRLADPQDGRALLARLTPKGVALARSLTGRQDERSKQLEEAFTLKEWQMLRELLGRLGTMIE
jgi:DNA-binding MarR family transcriptional regulator